MREDDGDGMACGLKSRDERVDVGRRLWRRRTVVVGHLFAIISDLMRSRAAERSLPERASCAGA